MPHSNTGGHEAVNDISFVHAAIPADALTEMCLAYTERGDLPVTMFAPYASNYGCGADALRNSFCRMMKQRQA